MYDEKILAMGDLAAGKMAARYHILILIVFPVLALLKAFAIVEFSWILFLICTGVALLAAGASVAAVGAKPASMLALSTIIVGSILVLLHRDGLLVLIFPTLIAMLYDKVKLIRLSFLFSLGAYILAEGIGFYFLPNVAPPGPVGTGIIMFVQLFILLNAGQTLTNRMTNKLETERVFMESISELLNSTTNLAEDMEMDVEKEGLSMIEKVKIETGKILQFNRGISNLTEENTTEVRADISLLGTLSDRLYETLKELDEEILSLNGATEGIGTIIEDMKVMAAQAAVEEVAMKEKSPEISEKVAEIGQMAFDARVAAERLREAMLDIGKDGKNAVDAVDRTYESVYSSLELINRNVETLLKWVVLKRG